MAAIEVSHEREGTNQWSYTVRVDVGGRRHEYAVTLGFSDYDLWCRGRAAPSKVVEQAFAFLLEREPAEAILARFDCSLIRRYFPEVDQQLPGRL